MVEARRPVTMRVLTVLAFSIAYFAWSVPLARTKLLWFDELVTLQLARLASLRTLCSAMEIGPDLDPPLYYVLTIATLRMVGEPELGIRLPAMVGVWLLCVSLFLATADRLPWPYALLALILPLAMGSGAYAVEGRPYGLVVRQI